MIIRSENTTIHYTDIASERGIGERRAKAIFAEVGRLAGIPAYSPRTWGHYMDWKKKKIEDRRQKKE